MREDDEEEEYEEEDDESGDLVVGFTDKGKAAFKCDSGKGSDKESDEFDFDDIE